MQEYLNSLYQSMPKRMAAAILAGKDHTKYLCTYVPSSYQFFMIDKFIHTMNHSVLRFSWVSLMD